MFQNLAESLPRRVEVNIKANGEYIWNGMFTKHMHVMFRCLQTFGQKANMPVIHELNYKKWIYWLKILGIDITCKYFGIDMTYKYFGIDMTCI